MIDRVKIQRADDDQASALARSDPAQQVLDALAVWRAESAGVFVVAIDGRGGAGKTTLARRVATAGWATLVRTDDFFQRTSPPTEPAPGSVALWRYYDWQRLREEALEPLRAGQTASFRRFDFARDGLAETVEVRSSTLIILEGVFSAAAELSDLIDRSVLVDIPDEERLRRLRARVAPDRWDTEWLAAEESYFSTRQSSFDLVVSGIADNATAQSKGEP